MKMIDSPLTILAKFQMNLFSTVFVGVISV